jgi:hypothetical protein
MGWIEKSRPTPFDDKPIPGLRFLDGDVVARKIGRDDWTAGQKYPEIVFPSGEQCDIWESSNPEVWGIVHIAGEMDLPFRDNRDRAFEQASDIAEQVGYVVRKVGENGLEFYGLDEDENYLIVYDNDTGQMKDVVRITGALDLAAVGIVGSPAAVPTPPERPLRMELLPDEVRTQLPDLRTAMEQGPDATAYLKLFSPDSGWYWYASGFDGEDVFYGMVVGYEIEFGPFWLSELREITGPWGLPIERDKFFEPKTLRELREEHRRYRGE